MKKINLPKLEIFTKIDKYIIGTTFTISIIVLLLGLRGIVGNPNSQDLNTNYWKDEGPLELSPERGRYALIYSVVEHKSFKFPVELARFAAPDVGYANGEYVSLFMPGTSLLAAPGYLIGKYLGGAQIGASISIAFFAFLNFALVYKIARKLNSNKYAALLGAITFLFASPSFAYAVTLYQHHISVFLLLLPIYLLLSRVNFITLALIWFCLLFSVFVDIPNLFLSAPIGLYALSNIINLKKVDTTLKVKIKPLFILSLLSIIFPIALILGFNYLSNGNFLKLPGATKQVPVIGEDGKPSTPDTLNDADRVVFEAQQENKGNEILTQWFKTRKILSGLQVHLASDDRGMLTFTPVLLAVIVITFFVINKNFNEIYKVLISVAGINLTLYSMWGDPWGGWAFGSRYMIPMYAILGIFMSVILNKYSKNVIVLSVYLVLMFISLRINTIGALTTSKIPPKPDVLALEKLSGKEEKFNYKKGEDFLNGNNTKSFVYKSYLSTYLHAWEYHGILLGILFGTTATLSLMSVIRKSEA